MKILLLCIGKTANAFMQQGIEEYSSRVRKYEDFELRALPAVKNAASLSTEELKTREGKLLLSELQAQDQLVLLDERGKHLRSMDFADLLQKERNASRKRVVFIVGGAYGVSAELRARANVVMSLSAMTLTHDMVRLFFVEQLYRAFTILAGEKYHHE